VNVCPLPVAHSESPELVQPSEGPLNYPAPSPQSPCASSLFSRSATPDTQIELPSTTARDPINLPVFRQPIQQREVNQLPDACLPSVTEPPPAGHARTAAQLLSQHLSRYSRCGARSEFPSDNRDPASEVCLPWVCALRVAVAVESDATKHREAKECTSIEHPGTLGNRFRP
jgi:hypothetical protein